MYTIDSENQHLVVLKRGEEIISSLTNYCANQDIQGAIFSGIGAVEQLDLARFDRSNKQYVHKQFDDIYELISLQGNFALNEGKPFCHIHVGIADHDLQMFGGHLFSGNIAVTGEIQVVELGKMPMRKPDPLGLNLICDVIK